MRKLLTISACRVSVFAIAGYLLLAVTAVGELAPESGPPRLVNGAIVEGALSAVTPEGLLVNTPKGQVTYPWKYLSPGTRYRYERPMLEELAAKAEAEAKAAAKREAAAKRAAEIKAAKEAAKKQAAAEKAAAEKAAASSDAAATNATTTAASADAAAGVDTSPSTSPGE